MKILEWLKLPETKNIKDLDDPTTTLLHADIVRKKAFLEKLYIDFYNQFKNAVPDYRSKVLVELGSGGGFIKEVIKNTITSDVLSLPNVDKVFSACDMPFEKDAIDAFFIFDVLHHISEPRGFFAEAVRCLKPGGKIVMIEPANTVWARFIYKNFHHESFDPNGKWQIEKTGPLSQANGAIPWIIFSRDREIFQKEFPSLKIIAMRTHSPFTYLLSGGLTLRQLLPSFAYQFVKMVECILSPANKYIGMFQTIELQKIE